MWRGVWLRRAAVSSCSRSEASETAHPPPALYYARFQPSPPLGQDPPHRVPPAKRAAFSRANAIPPCPFSSGSPSRSRFFHRLTVAQGSPTLRASALPIARRWRFQSMKRISAAPDSRPGTSQCFKFCSKGLRDNLDEVLQ